GRGDVIGLRFTVYVLRFTVYGRPRAARASRGWPFTVHRTPFTTPQVARRAPPSYNARMTRLSRRSACLLLALAPLATPASRPAPAVPDALLLRVVDSTT